MRKRTLLAKLSLLPRLVTRFLRNHSLSTTKFYHEIDKYARVKAAFVPVGILRFAIRAPRILLCIPDHVSRPFERRAKSERLSNL
jgi:hypothetical protein